MNLAFKRLLVVLHNNNFVEIYACCQRRFQSVSFVNSFAKTILKLEYRFAK